MAAQSLDEAELVELEQNYLTGAHILLDHLRQILDRVGLPPIRTRLTFGSNYYGEEPVFDYDIWWLLHLGGEQNALWAQPELRASEEAHWRALIYPMMIADGIAHPSLGTFEDYEASMRRVYCEPLLQALVPSGGEREVTTADIDTCTDERIITQYRRLRDAWRSPTLTWRLTAPLQHLDASALDSPITLSSQFALIPWTPDEKTRLWNRFVQGFGEYTLPRNISTDQFVRANWSLVSTVTIQRARHNLDMPAIGADAVAVLTSLRLIKPGLVRLPMLFLEAEPGTTTHQNYMVQNPLDLKHDTSSATYKLELTDIPHLREILIGVRHARSAPQPSGLGLPLNRFDQSYSRESLEDVILDLTIALESTLLASINDELSYRFALFGAALLAKSRRPQETFRLLRALYTVRSKLVHESQSLKQQESIWKKGSSATTAAEFVDQCTALTREVLCAYIMQQEAGHKPKDVCKQLEMLILAALEGELHD